MATMMVAPDLTVANVHAGTGDVDIQVNEGLLRQVSTVTQVTLTNGSLVEGTRLSAALDASQSVDGVTDTVHYPFADGLAEGELVSYTAGGGSPIGGLREGASYRVHIVDNTSFQLADTFDAGTAVDGNLDTITFAYDQDFQTGDKVVYDADGGTAIGGLVDGMSYYVRVLDSKTIKLAASQADATATPFAVDAASKISGDVIDLGVAHGFTNGEAITYRASGHAIGGLTSGYTYYVIKVSDTAIKLAMTRADALAATPKAITLDPTVATGNQTVGVEGVDLAPTGASGTQDIRIDMDPSTATGANQQFITDSLYLQVGSSVVRVSVVDDCVAEGRPGGRGGSAGNEDLARHDQLGPRQCGRHRRDE